MGAVLDEIRSGAFALEWQAEVADGSPHVREAMARVSRHPIEAARQRALGLVPGPPRNPQGVDQKVIDRVGECS